jgi:hypothetical protein
MSSCAPTDRLMQTLRVHTPGATDPVIELELYNSVDEFFRRTSAWQMEIPIELVKNQTEYAFPVPVNSTVVRVIGVTQNKLPVPAAGGTGQTQSSLGILDPESTFPDGDAAFGPSESDIADGVFSWAVYRPDYITTTTAPDEEQRKYPMEVLLALSLSRSCLECEDCGEWDIPEWMFDMYFQNWLDGTLGRLYGMPAKPWFNPAIAGYHARRFRNAMAFRKQETPRGFTWGQPGPWRFPRGWVR